MSARNNEDKRILEMELAIKETQERVRNLSITKEIFTNPTNLQESVLVDGVLFTVYRAVEEASNLSFETKSLLDVIPWDQVSGLRNRLAHDYPGVNDSIIWEVIHRDFNDLLSLCDIYWERRGYAHGERPH